MKVAGTAPYFDPESIEFVLTKFREILEGKSYLSQGIYCERFEEAFSSHHGTRYGVTVSSGTAALEAMIRSERVGGWEVILPTNTFAATAFAVISAGGIPVFADVGPDMSLDPQSVEDQITQRTRAVLTVHVGGLVSERIVEIAELCRGRGLTLFEDAAHSHGSSLRGKRAGSFGAAGAFSFFSTKVMTTGEGGMVITNDKERADLIKRMRDHSKVKSGIYQNLHDEIGFSWRMTEIQALMGLSQLRKLDDFINHRNKIAEAYRESLEPLVRREIISLVQPPPGGVHNYYKFVVLLSGVDRVEIVTRMRREFDISIGGFVYEVPLHLQPALKQYTRTRLPVAEDLCSRHICLPTSNSMTEDQARYVSASLARCLE